MERQVLAVKCVPAFLKRTNVSEIHCRLILISSTQTLLGFFCCSKEIFLLLKLLPSSMSMCLGCLNSTIKYMPGTKCLFVRLRPIAIGSTRNRKMFRQLNDINGKNYWAHEIHTKTTHFQQFPVIKPKRKANS